MTALRQIFDSSRSSARTPGFPSVVAHDVAHRGLGDRKLAFLEPGGLQLLGQQVADGDVHLLVLGVARETDHFHPVEERRRDVERIGGGDEHHLRQVVLDLDVVVGEGVVLLRIEHLEQRGRRIAAPVGAHLVDFVEQEERVLAPAPSTCSAGSCRASSRCRCGGGRGSRPRRARRRATCARTCGWSPWRSTGRARSCPRRARPPGTGSAPSSCRRASAPPGTRRCAP